LLHQFSTGDGQPLTLLAVADGHGAAAYSRSDVGSALACRAALEAVGAALALGELGGPGLSAADPASWRGWLQQALPEAICGRWLAAVERHGRSEPCPSPGRFTAQPYGTTLGLLLLAPGWWGYSGLGDWDLVRIGQGGAGELLSQEQAMAGGPEATASLCQGMAAAAAFRSGLWPLDPSTPPFALLLGTDGLRKSCASDADFLALASWLAPSQPSCRDGSNAAAEAVAARLAADLDRVSAEGCGDDVSVAIARWGEAAFVEPGAQQSAQQAAPQLAQPIDQQVAQPLMQPGAFAPSPVRLAWGSAAGSLAAARRPWAVATGLLALLAGAGGLWYGLVWVPSSRPKPLPISALPADARAPLRQEVERLCRSPGLVDPSLRSRRSQVLGLHQGSLEQAELLAAAARDPLGALIAASAEPGGQGPNHQNVLQSLAPCPILRNALNALWLAPLPRAGPLLRPDPRLHEDPAAARPPQSPPIARRRHG